MSKQDPFTLKIHVPNGDPDGLRIVERSNWTGKALIFPRSLLPTVKQRDEIKLTGVYLLLGPDDAGGDEKIYIGEGDPVQPRLESHFKKKDFWNRALFFVSKDQNLNKAHVRFLESRLIRLAKEAKNLTLDNEQETNEPSLCESDKADMEVFLKLMLNMLPALGISAFELPDSETPEKTRQKLFLKVIKKGVEATGYESNQTFVVLKGSTAVITPTKSLQESSPSIMKLRQKLTELEILEEHNGAFRFTQDYAFSSPSTAASVIRAANSNGRIEWKNEQGITLKELQEAQLQEDGNQSAVANFD